MAWDEFECTPFDENTFQVGREGYGIGSLLEYKYMKLQMERILGDQFYNYTITRKSNAHDFGTYYTMKVQAGTQELVSDFEDRIPQEWDEDIFVSMKKEYEQATGIQFPYKSAKENRHETT